MNKKMQKSSMVGVFLALLVAGQALAVAPSDNGFAGAFAPSNWQSGSNAPVNLINTTQAPSSITLSNYAPWRSSGATFSYSKAPSDGTVSFNYVLSGTTSQCPGSYFVGTTPTLLSSNGSTATFAVTAGTAFGFALNGQNLPNNFSCISPGVGVTMQISNFVFTPSSPTPPKGTVSVSTSSGTQCLALLAAPGASVPVTLASCGNAPQWKQPPSNGGKLAYGLDSNPSYCLDIDTASYTPKNVQIWNCYGIAQNQTWTYVDGQIKGPTGLCLSTTETSTGQLTVAPCNGTKWTFN